VDTSATLITSSVIQAGGLTINGTVTITPQTGTRNDAATLSVLGKLTIGSTGLLDLSNNDLVVQAAGETGLTTITAAIKQGYNHGTWTGTTGITSSTAASNNTGLGVELNDDGTTAHNPLMSTFDGQTVTNTDVLVKYTYLGDANLDGTINGADYLLIDNGFNIVATGWRNGDFNYDGVINGDDYTLIDNSFNTEPAGNPLASASPASQIAIPEPTSFSLLGLGAACLLRRRRNQQ
jgi:PEP-CTERM motif/Dockerin type I domain